MNDMTGSIVDVHFGSTFHNVHYRTSSLTLEHPGDPIIDGSVPRFGHGPLDSTRPLPSHGNQKRRLRGGGGGGFSTGGWFD